MKTRKPIFHKSCPKRLRTALHRAKGKNGKPYSFSALARQLSKEDEDFKVNKGTIYKLAIRGIEPKDEALRLALFLPRHPRKKRNPSPAGVGVRESLSPHRKWWNKQPKEFKDNLIYMEWLKSTAS